MFIYAEPTHQARAYILLTENNNIERNIVLAKQPSYAILYVCI